MAVDPEWLARVRRANQEKVGLGGQGLGRGMGASPAEILQTYQASRPQAPALVRAVDPVAVVASSLQSAGQQSDLVTKLFKAAAVIGTVGIVVAGVASMRGGSSPAPARSEESAPKKNRPRKRRGGRR